MEEEEKKSKKKQKNKNLSNKTDRDQDDVEEEKSKSQEQETKDKPETDQKKKKADHEERDDLDELDDDDDLDDLDDDEDDDFDDEEEEDDDDKDEDDDDQDKTKKGKEKLAQKPENQRLKNRIQNLFAVIIVLTGLLLGAIFVDVAQLFQAQGLSVKKMQQAEESGVIQVGDEQTWILNQNPAIDMTVVNDPECGEKCDVERIMLAFKQAIPTLVVNKVDYKTEQGKKLINEFDIKALPSFILEDQIKETDFFEQGKMILEEKNDKFLVDNGKARLPYGKYLVMPKFDNASPILGNPNAELEVIIFGDFQCPYSRKFQESFNEVFPKYKDQLKVSFYQLPLSTLHPKALDAANANLCAMDQDKFWEMNQELYANQEEWGKSQPPASPGASPSPEPENPFLPYARKIGLNPTEFKTCMDEKTHMPIIQNDLKVAQEFSINATPAAFIGDEFIGGAISTEEIESIINEKLGTDS
ncbi:MAG: thioredoxin domain-containing protein [Candidatus Moranbacteria bacterium]|nr:thioredoxin domain-containing protein [Candidatus Moranbacteria bacterium]